MAQERQQASHESGYTCTSRAGVVGVKESIESLIAKAVANSGKHPYHARKTRQDQMKRLLLLALTAATLLIGTTASACEKHLNGHQNGSDTDLEGSKK